jgi:hypothetical protein
MREVRQEQTDIALDAFVREWFKGKTDNETPLIHLLNQIAKSPITESDLKTFRDVHPAARKRNDDPSTSRPQGIKRKRLKVRDKQLYIIPTHNQNRIQYPRISKKQIIATHSLHQHYHAPQTVYSRARTS